MLKIIEDVATTDLISTIATGKLDQSDYDTLVPVLENKLKERGMIRWNFEMEDFNGWTPGDSWEALKFDLKHAYDFIRMAMVGVKKWQERITAQQTQFTKTRKR